MELTGEESKKLGKKPESAVEEARPELGRELGWEDRWEATEPTEEGRDGTNPTSSLVFISNGCDWLLTLLGLLFIWPCCCCCCCWEVIIICWIERVSGIDNICNEAATANPFSSKWLMSGKFCCCRCCWLGFCAWLIGRKPSPLVGGIAGRVTAALGDEEGIEITVALWLAVCSA